MRKKQSKEDKGIIWGIDLREYPWNTLKREDFLSE